MTINTPVNNDGNELRFGCINVCGLKRRLNYPEFYDTLSQLDILCVTETKLDHLDVINIPGYGFISQIRKQKFIRSSGGVAVIYKNMFDGKLKIIPTESDYIMWLRLDRSMFSTIHTYIALYSLISYQMTHEVHTKIHKRQKQIQNITFLCL